MLLIADAAQNGMARDARFATPRTVLLVQNGRVLRKNLEREMITEDEDSTTERIAATFGPAFALPTCSQFFRPSATGRIEFSARLLDNSTSA